MFGFVWRVDLITFMDTWWVKDSNNRIAHCVSKLLFGGNDHEGCQCQTPGLSWICPADFTIQIFQPFHERFLIVVQIEWKFHSVLIQIRMKRSLWTFLHVTTSVLSWLVQNVVAIWYNEVKLKINVPSYLNYEGKKFMKWAPEACLNMKISHWYTWILFWY